jgi:protein TIF31
MYLSTSIIDDKEEIKANQNFPHVTSYLSKETISDLGSAFDCDLELNQQFEINETKKEKLDSRKLFNPDNFSLLSMEKLITLPSLPKCVKSVTFSGWNPVPSYRKLVGDLFYLEVETLENIKYNVTCNSKGFYVNNTAYDEEVVFDPTPSKKNFQATTLIGLLYRCSKLFKTRFPKLLEMRIKKHPFEVTPVPFPLFKWIEPKQKHVYDKNRSEEVLFTNLGIFSFKRV